MALPTLITVSGTLLTPDGDPDSGSVAFEFSQLVRNGAGDDVMTPGGVFSRLDANGDFSMLVPANDDPAWTPSPAPMRMTLRLSGGTVAYDVSIPYDAPGAAVDIADLVPALPEGGVLYAAFAHTHSGYVTGAEVVDAVDSALASLDLVTGTELATALGPYATDADLANAIATRAPTVHTHSIANVTGLQTELDELADEDAALAAAAAAKLPIETVDGYWTIRKADGSSAMRIRATGGGVDIDVVPDIIWSAFDDADFDTGQINLLRMRDNGITLVGRTEFGSGAYAGEAYVVPGVEGVFGGKGDLIPSRHIGLRTAPGAPTTGYHEQWEWCIDSTGVTHICTVAGEPGTWTLYAPGSDASPLRMPEWVQPTDILTEFAAGHGWTNNAGSTLAIDTATYILNDRSARITTGGAGAQANLSKVAMPSFDATGKILRLRFRVDDVTNMSEIGCFLGTSNFVNFYKWSIQVTGTSRFVQPGEWCTITLSFANATSGGSPSRAALTDARLYVIDNNTGNPVVVNWQSFELIPDGSANFPNGVISICADDSYISQWNRFKPGLDQRGWPATLFTIDDYIDLNVNRLTSDQLKACHDHSGWEIAGHAATGDGHSASYTGLTAAGLDADIAAQTAWLRQRGFQAADGTAYPLGQYGKTLDGKSTLDIVKAHWGYARTTHARTTESYPPADRYKLRATSGISSAPGGYSAANVIADITKCKNEKTWLILVFHDIVASGAALTTQCNQADYDSILAAVASSGVPVATVSDVLRGSVTRNTITLPNSPNTPPAPGRGGTIFAQAGALKYIGSAGTVTQIAPS